MVSRRYLGSTRGFIDTGNRFIPPRVDLDEPNIANSENTALFLVSCYQYITTSVVISVGPPFRQPLYHNGTSLLSVSLGQQLTFPVPFLATFAVDLAVSTFMLARPPSIVTEVMQLTWMSDGYKAFLLALAICAFAVSWVAEHYVFPKIARGLGDLLQRLRPSRKKKRREYKVLLETMEMSS